jgi:N-methylhydantoinase A
MPEMRAGEPIAELRAAFATEHQRQYGHASLEDPIALVNLRLTVRVERPRTSVASAWHLASTHTPAAGAERGAWFGGPYGLLETPVIGRADLDATPHAGPLLIDEYDATTLVPPSATARLDDHGNIEIRTAVA